MWIADKLMFNGVSYDAAYSGETKVWEKPNLEGEYLTLEIVSAGTLDCRGSNFSAECSVNGGEWVTMDSTPVSYNAGDKIRCRAVGGRKGFNGTAYFNIRGNIMSMMYGENFRNKYTIDEGDSFINLFSLCRCLDASNLVLPATGLTQTCYSGLFYYSSIQNASFTLPADTVPMNGYQSMFFKCGQLTVPPVIAASTIGLEGCYQMFYECSALVLPPSLPATTVHRAGYQSMFQDCISLTTAPDLPAELDEFDINCYDSMFYHCSSLVNVPAVLPSTYVPDGGYNRMFGSCTALTTTSELPASIGSYVSMYASCYSLTTVRPISATTLEAQGMFYNCTSLVTAPEIVATTLRLNGLRNMFDACKSLTTPPSELKALSPVAGAYERMFRGCTALTSAPVICATTASDSMCANMFSDCTSLVTAPDLPATTLGATCYSYMFSGCTALTTAPSILPATTLEPNCYDSMFLNCSSLTAAPVLPATTLVTQCYNQMFSHSGVLSITCLAENVAAGQQMDSTYNWVDGVWGAGVFTKSANENDWPSGFNGIPNGWSVVDA